MPDTQSLLRKIEALPAERIAEIEDFVAFITARERERALVRDGAAASGPVLAAIWNNEEDAAYDAA